MDSYSSIPIEHLLHRCTISGEIGAWEEFVRRFHRPIAMVVLRTASRWGDASKQTVDDLIQETYLKLCANNCRILRDFEHRDAGAFAGYVKVIAANVVRDHFKSSHSQKRDSNRVDTFDEGLIAAREDSEGGPRSIERAVLLREVQHYLNLCAGDEDRERNTRIFWLHYRAGLTAAAISSLPGVGLTTKGVESLLLRITRELRERMAPGKPPKSAIPQKKAEGILPAESF
jgi:RNA polymerase sigma-70 factor (ECF subfamily)